MTETIPALTDAVAAYARQFHAAAGDEHHVASPLGAWLVLALAAPAARGAETDQLAEVLGMPVLDAAEIAGRLLDDPPPAVAAAAAAWMRAPHAEAAIAWAAGLPASVARGPIPSQHEADTWARDHTFGLIEKFPLELDPALACVLASALATRVSWRKPFTAVGSDAFRSTWRDRVRTALRTPDCGGHQCSIVHHHRVGDLAMHRAEASGLWVTSVIAADGVPAEQVLDAAHDAARHDAARHDVRSYSLFDLEVGDGHAWTISESDGWDGHQWLAAVLPAWSARSRHELSDPRLGFAAAARALITAFGTGDGWEAVQSAVARYHRLGFEAAAVTGLDVGAGMPSRGRQREALLRFDRPYAVVATTSPHRVGPWRGLPVFSAWITEPEDVII